MVKMQGIADCRMELAQEPISEEWLFNHGWRLEGERNDARTKPHWRLRRLPLATETIAGRSPFQSNDDLCIDVATMGDHEPGAWFCWIMQVEPYRFIHVRHVRYTWELIRLWEGLTGKHWQESRG